MLPEWHEQLRSGDQSFWFRPMVATDSVEAIGIAKKYDSANMNSDTADEIKFAGV